MIKKEATLSQQVSQYLQIKYPKVIYRFDYGADVRLTFNQATRMKNLQGFNSKGYPDLFIAQANTKYHGLFIELKAKSPFKKDGNLRKDEHLHRQQAYHNELIRRGYYATFALGLNETKKIIDSYLEGVKLL